MIMSIRVSSAPALAVKKVSRPVSGRPDQRHPPGYEEAAAQGLIAGWNAARAAGGQAPVILDRASAYIGVMIDDLVTKGGSAKPSIACSLRGPSIASSLRADNADQRLTAIGQTHGIVCFQRTEAFAGKMQKLAVSRETMTGLTMTPNQAAQHGVATRQDGVRRTALDLLSLPEVDFTIITRIWPQLDQLSPLLSSSSWKLTPNMPVIWAGRRPIFWLSAGMKAAPCPPTWIIRRLSGFPTKSGRSWSASGPPPWARPPGSKALPLGGPHPGLGSM